MTVPRRRARSALRQLFTPFLCSLAHFPVLSAVAVLLICLPHVPLVFSQASISTRAALETSPVSVEHPIEQHHSLHTPLDKTQVYWNYGGSTVLTNTLIRLTPSTLDRRGWLWNEYPIESPNWEVEWVMEVHSKPHFGGDGMCMWMLAGGQDPSFSQQSDALDGPVFGMKSGFDGMGVCVDVYDNDNKRNNPTVFVIEQQSRGGLESKSWHHDTDYEEDMVNALPATTPHDPSYAAHKCIADVRNTGKNVRMLVKLLHQVLHVYIDLSDSGQYKFCLAVQLTTKYRDYHLAFSSATGGVADNVDIKEVSTRYLKDTDREFNDEQLGRLKSGMKSGWGRRMSGFYWFIVNGASIAIIGIVGLQLWTYHSLLQQRIDLVAICQRINPFILPHYAGHAALTALLLLNGQWLAVLLNVPLLGWKVWEFVKKSWLFSPASVGPVKGHARGRVSVYYKLGGMLLFYAVMQLYYLYRFFAG